MLEIKVINAVLVEHSVRVVHPAVGRRVVVQRPVLLPVRHVERVREFQPLPASGVGGHALHVYFHVLADKALKAVRHVIVYAHTRQAHVGKHTHLCAARNDAHFGLGRIVLNGQEQEARRFGDGHDVLFAGKVLHLELRRGRQGSRHKRHCKCSKNVFQFHDYLFIKCQISRIFTPPAHHFVTVRQPAAFQYAVFYPAKGGLSACERRPFALRFAVDCKSNSYQCKHVANLFQTL